MVYLCLNIITSTFQLLRRPPELGHGDAPSLSSEGAAEGFTAVVHSRHLGGSVDETEKLDKKTNRAPFSAAAVSSSGVEVN